MNETKLQRNFFLFLFVIISIATICVFLPFLKIIAFSAIIAVVLNPVYEFILKIFKGHRGASASALIVLACAVVLTPAFFIGLNIFNESKNLYGVVENNQSDYISKVTSLVEDPIRKFNPDFSLDLNQYVGGVADWVMKNIGVLVSGTAYIIIDILFIIVSVYFFLKDGADFKNTLIKLSPLNDLYDRQITSKVEKTIMAVVRGALFIALIQGTLVGIGLYIFGVPNPTLWGSVAGFASLIPGFGTSLVILPAVAYLYLSGQFFPAVGFALWGFVLVGLIDNILAPYLYGRGVTVHPLAVLFSVLGGVSMLGPAGFIFGPIILTLFMSLLEIYREMMPKQNSSAV